MTRSALWTLLFAASALGFASRLTAADRPVPTKDAAARMTAPEGFRVTLFAGEPDVVQPIAFTFDDRGRMWVVECLSYPKWRADGKGNDRVTIFEDTDGDGAHDKRTVFLDDGSNLSGIELGFGGVWLCSLPNLVFIPDRNGDDKPDGPPEVLLDGWNLKDTKHNVFNSLGWGPDGWLYGCNGIQARSKVGRPGAPEKDRVHMDCGVWRYHTTRRVFEAFAHGTTNPFGLDWDEHGELFITNCVIDHLWHVVPGGHYRRMYGQDANPYVFDLMGPASDHKHWGGGHWTTARADQKTGAVQKAHDDAGGGHAHSGCCVYLGDNFPPEYRNSVFMCNIHGNRLNRDRLIIDPVTQRYVGKHAPDFLNANDPWFRGICIKYGPDGGLYVSDWTDTGECHNYDKADTSNGRIYKVTYGTPKPWRGDLSKLTDADLVKLQLHKNEWFVRKARRILQERAAGGQLAEETHPALRALLGPPGPVNVTRDLRALWALHVTGGLSQRDYRGMLRENNHLRQWAVVLAFESSPPDEEFLSDLGARASIEPSPAVYRAWLGALQRVPPRAILGMLRGRHPWTGVIGVEPYDKNLLAWYAIQPTALAHPGELLDCLNRFDGYVRVCIVRSVLTAPGADLPSVLDKLVTAVGGWDARLQGDVLLGMELGLTGRTGVKPPGSWRRVYAKAVEDPGDSRNILVERVGLLLGDPLATDAVRKRALDPATPVTLRRESLERLIARRVAGLGPALRGLVGDRDLRAVAVRGLAAYPDPDTPADILKVYPTFTVAEKADAVQTLASRPAFANALLDAVEKGIVPKSDVTALTARQIQAINDKAVSERLAKVWGTVRAASTTRATQAEKYKSRLTADRLKAADLSNGRAVFAKHCASCHKLFGEGGDVGPELTGSQRANLDYVLENVLDPSAVVPGEYRMTAFALLDGRTLTGIVRKETPQAITVRTVNEEVIVPVADIDARKPTALSVMPDGLLDALKEDEVRDLVAYLASPRQVPVTGSP